MYINISRIAYFLWGFGLFAVLVVSLLPPDSSPQITNLPNDKIRHLAAYAFLTLLACQAGLSWTNRYLLSGITFGISVLIEFLQPLTGRDFELLDMLANFSGVLLGIILTRLYFWWRGANKTT